MGIDNIIQIYGTEEDTILKYFKELKNNWIYEARVIGKDGNEFTMYKFKTMNDEYMNDYDFKLENSELNDQGKFLNDDRIIESRRWMRLTFVDELPQFINLLKREMKLIGVRPKMRALLKTYSLEEQKQISSQRPGWVGVQYVDDYYYLTSERKYLKSYEKHPIFTDIIYGTRIAFRIIFMGVRSS